tara:strand:+ start:300 stop:914 length:615 start_codon:yes stop_codon:yes gene_type:complete
MNITLDSETIRKHPAFASPLRLGVLAHLAAFASGETTTCDGVPLPPYCVVVSPAALAATLSCSRGQIENAISSLFKHEMVSVDKTVGKRGYWLIDMRNSKEFFSDGKTLSPPTEVNIRSLMDKWDRLYEKRTGVKYMRSRSDYWKEQADWNNLFQNLGGDVMVAMEKYFDDIRFGQWGYAFKVFFKAAPRLTAQPNKAEPWQLR